MDTPVTAVIAGSYQQFVHWCSGRGVNPHGHEVIYVSSPAWLRGRCGIRLEYAGTWHERRDAQEIRDAVTVLEATGMLVP